MLVGRLSLAGTFGGPCELRAIAIKAARHVPLGLSMLLILTVGGCRTPWRTASSEPSFDRLIEIEQQSGQRGAGRGALASRLRPGQSQDPANYMTADSGQGLVPPAAANELTNRRGGSNRPKNASREADRTSDMEEMLVDVPPAQRELLRREMSALQARNLAEDIDDPIPSPRAHQKSPVETRAASAHRSINDDHIQEADFVQTTDEASARSGSQDNAHAEQDGYTDTSKYQLAARKSNRQPRDASAKPNGVDEPYSRKLTDQAPARPDSTIDVAERTAPPADVVSASYASAGQPVDSALQSSEDSEVEISADSLDWRQHIAAAISQLEQQAASDGPQEQVHRQMVDRLLHLSLGDIEAASEPIEGLQTNGQDFIRHSLKALFEVTNPTGNPVDIKLHLSHAQPASAAQPLGCGQQFRSANATFCTEVDGFGVVTKFPQYAFKPDQELLLYCELDNFVSTHTEGKGYETQLQGSYEIVDSSGRRIADQLLPMDSHLCRNQRRDYFIAYRIYMPQKVEPGKYQLKLTVEDMKGRKFGQSTLDFQIQ
ncbi:MAG: hypothetical protein R3C56_03735 [Pirellulaceae bacterium]